MSVVSINSVEKYCEWWSGQDNECKAFLEGVGYEWDKGDKFEEFNWGWRVSIGDMIINLPYQLNKYYI